MNPSPGSNSPAKTLLLAPTRRELGTSAIRRRVRLSADPLGSDVGRIVGVGATAAATAASLLASGQYRTAILIGFAGGLNPDLQTGDAIVAGETNEDLVRALRDAGVHARRGVVVTAAGVVAGRDAKADLAARGDVVAMEDSHVERACGDAGVGFVSVRVVLDDAATPLSPEISGLATAANETAAAISALLRRPRLIVDLVGLGRRARVAQAVLGRVAVTVRAGR